MILLVLFSCIANIEALQRTKEDCDYILSAAESSLRIGETQASINYFASWKCYKEIGIEHPEFLQKAIQLAEGDYEKLKDTYSARHLGEIYTSLGEIYNDSSKYDTAIEWYLKSCEYERRIKYNCAFEYASIADCYAHKGDTENACKWCEESNKEGPGFMRCNIAFISKWDYPKPTSCGYKTDNSGSSSGSDSSSSGFDVSSLLIPVGVLLVLAVLAAFFLIKKRKQKKKP
jgi:tetratricopeptide (TPR) repeat protein